MVQKIAGLITFAMALVLAASGAHGQADSAGSSVSTNEISSDGKGIYQQMCQACHMADAKGAVGAGASIPALAGNANLSEKGFLVKMLLDGRGGMPGFSDALSEKQIAAVATYVRSHYNSYSGPVTEADVKQFVKPKDPPSPE